MENIIGRFCCVFAFVSLLFVGCKTEMESAVDNNPPAEVTNVRASSGDKTVSLYWVNPDDSDFYATRITFEPTVRGVTQPVVIEGEKSSHSSAVFNGLENGTEYTFTLITMDKNQNKSNGVSYKAAPIEPKDVTPPAEVENLNVKAGDKSAVISWTNPGDDDFCKVQITFTPEVKEIMQPIVIQGEKNKASSTTISGLENNTEYTFKLFALDNTLNKSKGVSAKVTPLDFTPPTQINNVNAVSGDRSVTLSWTNPNDIDFDFVEISFIPENAKIKQPIVVKGGAGKAVNSTISELENDMEYTFTLVSVDKSLNKSTGVSIKAIPKDVCPPLEVKGLSAVSGDKTVILSWTNPNDNDFVSLELSFVPEVENLLQPIVIQGEPGKNSTFTINGLNNNTEYTFTLVTLDNKQNKSTGVVTKSTPKDVTPPSVVEDITAVLGDESVILSWTNPNDIDFDGVEISFTPLVEGITQPTIVKGEPGKTSSTAICGLKNEKKYTFKLYSLDKDMNKSKCVEKSIYVAPVWEISDLCAYYNERKIELNWNNRNFANNDYIRLKNVVISYIYNDDKNDIENGELVFDAETEKTVIEIGDKRTESEFLWINIRNVDEYGRESQGTSFKLEFNNCIAIKGDGCNAIPNLTESQKIIVLGTEIDKLKNVIWPYNKNKSNIKFDLDLSDMTGITSVYFPDFKNINRITLPVSVTRIPSKAFSGCESLTSITIPDSVTSIGESAFSRCNSLKSITIPDSVTSIARCAFEYCTSLTSVIIPDGMTSIEEHTFGGCESLTSITIPDSVTSIGEGAFRNCTSLKSITIPDSVTSIGDNAFSYCTSLKSLTFPNGVTRIVLEGCTSLKSITIPDGVTYISLFYCTSLESITIPDGVTFIGLSNCKSLTSVTIPDGVTYINLANCKSLTSITIPDSVTSIGRRAFEDCASLKSVIIPDSVTSIGEDAFRNCTSLKSITIPDSVTSIGDGAFSYCTSLKSLTFPNGVTRIYLESCTSLTSVKIPDGVTYISLGDCTSLKSVIIPNGVTRISLSGCTSLESVKIPDGVTFIALGGCTSLKSVIIPDSVTTITVRAFSDCTSLKSVTIPASVITIESNAFEGCQNLSNVFFKDISTLWKCRYDKTSEKVDVDVGDSQKCAYYLVYRYCEFFWEKNK